MAGVNGCRIKASFGRKPWGRIWHEQTMTWSIDKAKQRLIQDVAERYLAGERLLNLSKEKGVNHSFICRLLRELCGPERKVTYRGRTHLFSIPELLPPEIIRQVQQRIAARRTFPQDSLSNGRKKTLEERVKRAITSSIHAHRLRGGKPILTHYTVIMSEFKGQCGICGLKGSYEELDIDHCHKTGIFREWLCSWCNHLIGHSKEDAKTLEAAIKYLLTDWGSRERQRSWRVGVQLLEVRLEGRRKIELQLASKIHQRTLFEDTVEEIREPQLTMDHNSR